AEKTYICPGCSTAVLPGIAHLVVWADDHLFGAAAGLAERRHWHTNCWTSRNFRYR
ncbi:MAG TPA: ATP/GTP-binding protein, partial [Arthrobacter sp.]|nr:ATP/GTP-binding protein [Arthrobacter sp.]